MRAPRERDLRVTPVVTCFLRSGGDVLLLRRSGEVGSYRGRWGAVAGHAEGDPAAAARREIAEETGLGGAVELVRRGEPFAVDDAALGTRWLVHPYLFDCSSRQVALDWESVEHAWVPPTEILRRTTVPELWTSWRRVAPTTETVEHDREHGSAWIALAALEVLRDRAGELAAGVGAAAGEGAEGPELAALARRLAAARPAMAAPANRVHRAMREARAAGGGAAAVERAAHAGIERALAADRGAAERAAEQIAGRRVLTLSRSGTVEAALTAARPRPPVVVVLESRPGGEGVGVAERLAAAGLRVILAPDAAVAWAIAEHRIEAVLIGADTVRPSGLVNKAGTLPAALAARAAGIPVWAVAACDKVAPAARHKIAPRALPPPEERAEPGALYGGAAEIEVAAPFFEVTPAELVTAVITERGALAPAEIAAVAREMAELETW